VRGGIGHGELGIVREEGRVIIALEHRAAAPSIIVFAARAIGEPLTGGRDAG